MKIFQCFFIKGKFYIHIIIFDLKGRKFLDVEIDSFLCLSGVVLEDLPNRVVELLPLEQATLNKVAEGDMKEFIIANNFPLLKFIINDKKAPDKIDEVIVVFGQFVDGGMGRVDNVCILVLGVGCKNITQKTYQIILLPAIFLHDQQYF